MEISVYNTKDRNQENIYQLVARPLDIRSKLTNNKKLIFQRTSEIELWGAMHSKNFRF